MLLGRLVGERHENSSTILPDVVERNGKRQRSLTAFPFGSSALGRFPAY